MKKAEKAKRIAKKLKELEEAGKDDTEEYHKLDEELYKLIG